MDGGRKWSEATREKREKERERIERERRDGEEGEQRATEEREERQIAREAIRRRDITLSERGRNNKQR